MAVKLVAMYRRPDDEAAFMAHYEAVHLPLVRKTPHLEKTVVGRVTGSPMGEPPYFLIAEMRFPDRARFDEAMKSPENRAAAKDLMGFAAGLVTLLVVEEQA
jgi:uncharacterized protein (TIGR02118 family)